MRVAVIGGGAAGFFSAIHAKMNHPKAEVIIFEKTKKVLSKVKVSGGGRCNVTNACTAISKLSKAYPRGEKALKKAFNTFYTVDTIEWFESRGVKLVTQEDQCIFPASQDSQTIIDCFLSETRRLGVKIQVGAGIARLEPLEHHQIKLHFLRSENVEIFDRVIVATGGSPKLSGLEWLAQLGHQIETPVPSLFTFNMPSESVRDLMGIVVENAQAAIQGTKLKASGPLLITHWGMSGPAILKLSAFGARILADKNYQFATQVNWIDGANYEAVMTELNQIVAEHPKKIISNYRPFLLPERLWLYLVNKCELEATKKWQDLGKKGLNKIANILTHDVYQVSGKTTFKEEFVTCGGVSLSDIDMKTMQSRVVPNLYFAGEVLDIDGITGGYNFQAAWTTGFIAGKLAH